MIHNQLKNINSFMLWNKVRIFQCYLIHIDKDSETKKIYSSILEKMLPLSKSLLLTTSWRFNSVMWKMKIVA